MYDNIGAKLKGLAKAVFIILSLGFIVLGIVLICIDEDFILIGILQMVIGPFLAWVSSWVLYGFGEIIDKLTDIEINTRKHQPSFSERQKIDSMKKKAAEKANKPIGVTKPGTTKRCPFCGEPVKTSTCDMCGKTNDLFTSHTPV